LTGKQWLEIKLAMFNIHITLQHIFCTQHASYAKELNASVKEPNKFHNYETEKITCKASDASEYIKLFGSSARDRHARCIYIIP